MPTGKRHSHKKNKPKKASWPAVKTERGGSDSEIESGDCDSEGTNGLSSPAIDINVTDEPQNQVNRTHNASLPRWLDPPLPINRRVFETGNFISQPSLTIQPPLALDCDLFKSLSPLHSVQLNKLSSKDEVFGGNTDGEQGQHPIDDGSGGNAICEQGQKSNAVRLNHLNEDSTFSDLQQSEVLSSGTSKGISSWLFDRSDPRHTIDTNQPDIRLPLNLVNHDSANVSNMENLATKPTVLCPNSCNAAGPSKNTQSGAEADGLIVINSQSIQQVPVDAFNTVSPTHIAAELSADSVLNICGNLGNSVEMPQSVHGSTQCIPPKLNKPTGNLIDNQGQVKTASFASVLKQSSNLRRGKGKLIFYPPIVSDKGVRTAVVPDNLVMNQAAEWALTLTGHFIGKRSSFPYVQYHCRRMWNKFDLSEVIINEQGFFFFKFTSEIGMNSVFENGPWLFNGMPIFLQKWKPGLSLSKPEATSVPLWVNIHGLPLDLWDFDILSHIVSAIGKPVSVDKYTEEMCENKVGRINFARVLIEVSGDFDLPSEVDAIILGRVRKFKLDYLWKPSRCGHCKVFGHDLSNCQLRPVPNDTKQVLINQQDKPVKKQVFCRFKRQEHQFGY